MVNKRKILLTAAVAGLFAAGAVVQQAAPAFADESQQTGDQHSCAGQGGCKGDAAAGAPATGEGDAAAETKAAKPRKVKAKGKHKKKKKAAAEANG